MSCRTASYFSSRPTAATHSSRNRTGIPSIAGPDWNHVHSQSYTQAGAQAQTTGNSPKKIARFFYLKPSTPRRSPTAGLRASPALRTCEAPAPAAKYMYIDALDGKTVTRETLLRYTYKSHSVNDLIRGRLWEFRTSGGRLPGYRDWSYFNGRRPAGA